MKPEQLEALVKEIEEIKRKEKDLARIKEYEELLKADPFGFLKSMGEHKDMSNLVKFVTADGIAMETTDSNSGNPNIFRAIPGGGKREYKLSHKGQRFSTYSEVVVDASDSDWSDIPSTTKGFKVRLPKVKVPTPSTIKEILKAYTMPELIRLKLEDVQFTREPVKKKVV